MLYDSLVSVFIILHILFQDNKSFIIQFKYTLPWLCQYLQRHEAHSNLLEMILNISSELDGYLPSELDM